MIKVFILPLLLLATPLTAQEVPCAKDGADGPLAVSRAWWTEFATGNTVALDGRTAPLFSWTASNGRTFDRAATLAKAAMHDPKARILFDWKDGAARLLGTTSAVVTNRIVETIRTTPPATYRYVAVTECSDGYWRVTAAQSTREAELSPRLPTLNADDLHDFVGSYRAASGRALKIEAAADALILTDPSGAKTRFETVGRDLFEASEVSGAGVIRFVFHRSGNGEVVAFSRLASNITLFPRIAPRERPTRQKH